MLRNDLKDYVAIDLWPTRPDIIAIATVRTGPGDNGIQEEDIITKEDAIAITSVILATLQAREERYQLLLDVFKGDMEISTIRARIEYYTDRVEYTRGILKEFERPK